MFPSLLERYLFVRLTRASGLALLVLSALYLGFDLGDQGRRLAAIVGWPAVLQAALLRLPLIAAQLLPAALLLGGALATARLQRRQELQAMRGLGFSSWRLTRSVVLVGLGAATLMVLLLEGAAPPCEAAADALRDHRRPSPLLGDLSHGRWQRSEGGWLHRQGKRGLALRLRDARVVERHDGLRRGGLPPKALHLEERAGAVRSLRFSSAGIRELAPRSAELIPRPPTTASGPIGPRGSLPRPEALSSSALRARMLALRAAGQSDRVEALVLHMRHAYPLLALIAALLLFGLLDGPPRSHTSHFTHAVAWMGLLWALVAGAFSAARAGIVDPVFAAWLPLGLTCLFCATWLAWRKRASPARALP